MAAGGGIGPSVGGAEAGAQPTPDYGPDLVPNQFDPNLTPAEQYAACGPAAAVALARSAGQDPTLRAVVDLARTNYLWDPEVGMYGADAERELLYLLGLNATLERTSDWAQVVARVREGIPVVVDTPAHYFVASGYDETTGELFLGFSGTAFKAGSRWMTPEAMEAMAGRVRGMLYLA